MPTGKYERELKGILMGDKETIDDVTKTVSDEVKQKYNLFIDNPLLINRGAGSLGVDLMGMRDDMNFVIEVKSSKTKTIYLSNQKRLSKQHKRMIDMMNQYQVHPLYAFRLKNKRGERWKIYSLDDESIFPSPSLTNQGNYKLEWENGMWLNQFALFLDNVERR